MQGRSATPGARERRLRRGRREWERTEEAEQVGVVRLLGERLVGPIQRFLGGSLAGCYASQANVAVHIARESLQDVFVLLRRGLKGSPGLSGPRPVVAKGHHVSRCQPGPAMLLRCLPPTPVHPPIRFTLQYFTELVSCFVALPLFTVIRQPLSSTKA